MTTLKKGVVYNYIGQAWAAIMGVAFIPFYVSRLGVEAYAIVGLFSILLSWMSVADLGLTATISREMAVQESNRRRVVFNTYELTGIVVATLACVGMLLCSNYVTTHWLKPQSLAPAQIATVFSIIVGVLLFRWIEQFYRAALLGLQDTLWLNIIWSGLSTIRWGGGALAIAAFNPSLETFFLWQLASSSIGLVALRLRVLRRLPLGLEQQKHDFRVVRHSIRFSGGMFLGTILSFVLTNFDKITVTRILPLADFGYYTLAFTLASCLLQIVAPMNNSMLPVFTRLAANKDSELALCEAYMRSSILLSAMLIPPALVMIVLGKQVLILWTGDVNLANQTYPLLSVLAGGMLCNCLMNLPHIMQLAHGWVKLSVCISATSLLLFIPGQIFATTSFGSIGAASVWLILNLSAAVVTCVLMYRRILSGIGWRWFRMAVVAPIGVGAIPVFLIWLNLPATTEARTGAALAVLAAIIPSAAFTLLLAKRNISRIGSGLLIPINR